MTDKNLKQGDFMHLLDSNDEKNTPNDNEANKKESENTEKAVKTTSASSKKRKAKAVKKPSSAKKVSTSKTAKKEPAAKKVSTSKTAKKEPAAKKVSASKTTKKEPAAKKVSASKTVKKEPAAKKTSVSKTAKKTSSAKTVKSSTAKINAENKSKKSNTSKGTRRKQAGTNRVTFTQNDMDKLCEVYDWYLKIKDIIAFEGLNKGIIDEDISTINSLEGNIIKEKKSISSVIDRETWEEFGRLCSNLEAKKGELLTYILRKFNAELKELL